MLMKTEPLVFHAWWRLHRLQKLAAMDMRYVKSTIAKLAMGRPSLSSNKELLGPTLLEVP